MLNFEIENSLEIGNWKLEIYQDNFITTPMSSITRNIILIIILVLVLAGGYFIFFSKGPSPLSLLQKSSLLGDIESLGIRGDFLKTLLGIKNIEQVIKTGNVFFESNAFKQLKDFPVDPYPDLKPGRLNPFAPLGVDPEVSPTPAPEEEEEVAAEEEGAVVE